MSYKIENALDELARTIALESRRIQAEWNGLNATTYDALEEIRIHTRSVSRYSLESIGTGEYLVKSIGRAIECLERLKDTAGKSIENIESTLDELLKIATKKRVGDETETTTLYEKAGLKPF